MADTARFDEFVASCSRDLLRFAWVLTGDGGAAEDLVQAALLRSWRRWDRVSTADDPVRYVRAIMVNLHTTSLRRRWRNEIPSASLPEAHAVATADLDLRRTLFTALRLLPRRQRSVIALRYYADCTEQETARLMGCSVGTIKSQTAKAMATLRRVPGLAALTEQQEVRQ